MWTSSTNLTPRQERTVGGKTAYSAGPSKKKGGPTAKTAAEEIVFTKLDA